jgi:hypothetical protein
MARTVTVSIRDHLRPVEGEDDGTGEPRPVYRVVGTGESIALLRVTDAAGRRGYTGDVRRVPREQVANQFEPAADPDGGLALRHRLRTLGSGLYWSLRRFLP